MNLRNDYIREHYIKTLAQREELLEKWRSAKYLTCQEQQAVWVLLSDTVASKVRSHYRQANPSGDYTPTGKRQWFQVPKKQHDGYDRFTEQVLILAEFIKRNNTRSIGWCFSSWKRRFQQLEEIRQLKERGIAGVEYGQEQSAVVRDSIVFRGVGRSLSRKGVEPNQFHVLKELTTDAPQKRVENLTMKIARFELMRQAAYPVSLEELPMEL